MQRHYSRASFSAPPLSTTFPSLEKSYRYNPIIGLILLLCCFCVPSVNGQTATVRGFVTDRANGDALLGVNVVLEDDGGTFLGAVTDGDGVYSISRVTAGRYFLRASYVGFQTYIDTLDIRTDERRIINIALVQEKTELDEVVVETERESGAASVTAGLQSVTPNDIDLVPSPDITGDLASYLTVLPGIITLGDRGGQLFVRGGEPAHNMIFLDGMYVHQPFHVLGFYSAFPSDILSRVDVHAAGYSSRFSGRVASVIDVYSRNGNIRRFNGAVSMAPFVSSVLFEGPISRDKVSFLVSYRKSVIEQLAQHYVDQQMPYDFADFFGKVYYAGSDNHRLSFTFLDTQDRGTIGEPSEDRVLDEIRYSNRSFGLRYLVLPRRIPFIAEILLSSSSLHSELGPVDNPVRYSNLKNFNYAVNITNFIGTAEWHWGLFWRAPEISSYLGGIFQNLSFGFGRRHKAGLYIEPDFYLTYPLEILYISI